MPETIPLETMAAQIGCSEAAAMIFILLITAKIELLKCKDKEMTRLKHPFRFLCELTANI
ncbi:hypothetical protein B5M07_18790 (plasmid) [Sulfitobacter sp. D7]|nr:hypothetical protein B5M07_18790 [Sulfitobacter sp. D7]